MAVDIIARALAASLISSDGTISPDKLPVINTEEPVKYSVGGIEKGDRLTGQNIFDVIIEMLYGAVKPVLVDPYIDVYIEKTVGIAGTSFITNGRITFNRGKIEPAYGTSGYRSGEPTSYSYNGITINTDEMSVPVTISIPVLKNGNNIIEFKVNYLGGEQPLDSLGNPCENALPEGFVSKDVIIIGEDPIYVLNDDGQFVPVDPDGSYYDEGDLGTWYQVEMGAETNPDDRQAVAINSSYNILGIKVFDELTQNWQWLGSEGPTGSMNIFKMVGTRTEFIGDSEITYAIYQSDKDSEYHPIGKRLLRFYTVLPIDD